MPGSNASVYFRWFLYLYVFCFIMVAYLQRNNEFLYYSLLYLCLLLVVYFVQRAYRFRLQLPGILLLGFAVFGVAHVLGALVRIDGIRLYDIGFGYLHYDNLVHSLGSFLITVASFNLLFPYLHERIRGVRLYLFLLLLLISLGIGSLNEIIEFSAFRLFGAEGVGGYVNNAFDLVFNLLGALVGCAAIALFLLKRRAGDLSCY